MAAKKGKEEAMPGAGAPAAVKAGGSAAEEKRTITISKEALYAIAIVFLLMASLIVILILPKPSVPAAQVVAQTPQGPQQVQVPSVVVGFGDLPPLGNPGAPVSLIEFTDFQCAYCAKFHSGVEQAIIADYVNTSKVKFYHRDLPLGFHDKAYDAAIAAQCANEQGKFWEMRDTLMGGQQEWSILLQQDAGARFESYASGLGMNSTRFDACYGNRTYASGIKDDENAAAALGISATPTFAIVIPKSMAPALESNFSSVRALLPVSLYATVRLAQDGGDYVVIVEGSQPYPVFKAIFDKVNY